MSIRFIPVDPDPAPSLSDRPRPRPRSRSRSRRWDLRAWLGVVLPLGLTAAAVAAFAGWPAKPDRVPHDQMSARLKQAAAEGDEETIARMGDELAEERAERAAETLRQLPGDAASRAAFAEAVGFYDEPNEHWSNCMASAAMLRKRGQAADAVEMLKASAEVMRRLGVVPKKDQRSRAFLSLYESFRETRTHRETIDRMVELEKFGNEPEDEIPVAKEPDTFPRKNEPRYGGIILLALMKQANKKIVPGRNLREWLDDLTEEQKLAILLQKATDPREFFRRGWSDQVPYVTRVLRASVGTPAAVIVADSLDRLAPILARAKPGEFLADADDELVIKIEARFERIEKAYSRDTKAFLHKIWVQSGQGATWDDWR
jgi:hypothetical protein